MDYGIGIDASLALSFAEQRALVRESVERGYASAWCPSGPATRDGFQVCGHWSLATQDLIEGGIPTGIAVIPAPLWTVSSLASQAGTLAEISGGRFTLGIGTGTIYSEDFRNTYGVPNWPVVRMMRDYLTALKGLLNGESVTHHGVAVNVTNMQISGRPLPAPVYTAALGPQMLHLAGELADGVSLNWTAPAFRGWVREQVAKGADKGNRDASAVRITEYIRVCIDEDEEAARKAFVRAFMGYGLARPGASKTAGYRGHFTRMGYDGVLTKIENRRDEGASMDEIVDMFPPEFLREMGYYGKAAGCRAALERLSEGLDLAMVRIVGVRPGMDAARAVMLAGAPG